MLARASVTIGMLDIANGNLGASPRRM